MVMFSNLGDRSFNEDPGEERQAFAASLAPVLHEAFSEYGIFEESLPPCPRPITIVQRIIIPYQYRDDEDTQEKIAYHLLQQTLVGIDKLCEYNGGRANNFSISHFEVVDDAENQIGLVAHVACLADLPKARKQFQEKGPGTYRGHPEMQTREERIRDILGE